jgi:hypothetical protein
MQENVMRAPLTLLDISHVCVRLVYVCVACVCVYVRVCACVRECTCTRLTSRVQSSVSRGDVLVW